MHAYPHPVLATIITLTSDMDSFDTILTLLVDGSLDSDTAFEQLIRASESDTHPGASGMPGSEGSPLPVNADTIGDYGSYCTIA